MDSNQKAVISLIKSALTNQPVAVAETVDWDVIYQYAQSHQIVPLVYYGMVYSKLSFSQKQNFMDQTMQCVLIEQQQLNCLSEIEKTFSDNAIHYLPIKGTLLKQMYPKTEMRVMGDSDILIQPEQYESIRSLLSALGYQEGAESDHELHWDKKPFFHLELHKRLIPQTEFDYYRYYQGKTWKDFFESEVPYRFQMTPEDHLVFLIIHLAKHFRGKGIGLRHLVDIWVYLRYYPDLNQLYLRKELAALSLEQFFDNILATVQNWFEAAPATEVTERITVRTFESGAYGTLLNSDKSTALVESNVAGSGGVQKAKRNLLLYKIFLPYDELKIKYPILVKIPFLTPVFWVVRWIDAILFKRKNIKREQQRLAQYDSSVIRSYEDELSFFGLQFDLSERK